MCVKEGRTEGRDKKAKDYSANSSLCSVQFLLEMETCTYVDNNNFKCKQKCNFPPSAFKIMCEICQQERSTVVLTAAVTTTIASWSSSVNTY